MVLMSVNDESDSQPEQVIIGVGLDGRRRKGLMW